MCGIFGLACLDADAWPLSHRKKLVIRLFKLSQSRGREAAGLAVLAGGELRVHRAPLSADRMLASQDMREFMDWAFAPGKPGPWACLGHARLTTNGSETDARNNQPIFNGHCALVHNGIVVNDGALWQRMPTQRRESEVDSEALLKYWQDLRARGWDAEAAWQKVYGEIEGTASVGVIDAMNLQMGWLTNNGSVYWAQAQAVDQAEAQSQTANETATEGWPKSSRSWVFASERPILQKALRGLFPGAERSDLGLHAMPAGGGQWLNLGHASKGESETETNESQAESKQSFAGGSRIRPMQLSSSASLAASDKRLAGQPIALPAMRRCTRCILPETMPFIRFDAQGICQWCREYQPLALRGPSQLEEVLAKYRRRDGKPDCLVAFSGGRDSCYGLHLLKREFGMNPVAFTYDWGMVTDLARRNQARMCGALGVEHIIVADDMHTKQRNIRLNLQAWLRKPHLGMIPLLTAGDKHFFTHANRISREMGIELVVFFENPYEQTRFKTGFLGVEERAGRVYDLKVWQSLQLAAHYLGEFVKNPGYINLSLLDTFKAFVASYGKSHPYLFPFQYVPWRESEVDATLLHRYGWETSPDSVSTWRIGDGTAAFYNFVYYTVAGFTEFDTFRSNQIREGFMTRESALAAIACENRTRWESMQDYAQRVGVDCEEIVSVVENMPKLYSR